MTALNLRHWAMLMAVLLLALALRFAMLLSIEHNVDRAYPIWQALMTLDRGYLPVLGQGTSVLFANPALTGYLFLPVVAVTRSAAAVYAFAIVLNTCGILFAWRAVWSLFGGTPALIAAFLLAVNPWLIEYSRATWVQGLLPFFIPLIASLLIPVWQGTSRKPGARFIAACVALIACAQTYLLAYAAVLPVALLTLIYRRRVPMQAITLGALIVFVPSMAYAAALLAEPVTTARIESFADDAPRFSLEALNHALRLVSGIDYAAARGTLAPAGDAAPRQFLSGMAHLLLSAALVAGLIRAVVNRQRDALIIAGIWFFLPVLLMSYVGHLVHPFYQLLGVPAGAALAAYGLAWALRRQTVPLLLALGMAFAVLMGVNSIRYAQETAALPGEHGLSALPLSDGLALGAVLRDQLPPGGRIHADVDEFTLVSLAGAAFDFMREARAPQVVLLPASGGLYVTMGDVLPAASREAAVIDLADGRQIRVSRFAPGAPLPADLTPLEVPGDHGLMLAGYALRREGDQWRLWTGWRVSAVDERTPLTLFAPFAHLFNAAGERIAIVDGAAVPGFEWRAGDLHLHEMAFADPGETFSVQIGQYDGGAGINVIFVLPDGTYSALIPVE